MIPPSDRAPFFNEAAREAAARVIVEYEQRYAAPNQDHRNEARDVLNAALEALPPRSKAILALAELTDEELVERVADALVLTDSYDPRELSAGALSLYRIARLSDARAVLTALGLPVAAEQETCPDPNCNEGIAGPDDQRCATCDGEGFVRASDGAQDECEDCYDERRADARPPAEQEPTGGEG